MDIHDLALYADVPEYLVPAVNVLVATQGVTSS